MRSYIILAVLSVSILCVVLLFVPVGGRRKPVTNNTKEENKIETSEADSVLLIKTQSPTADKPKDREKFFEVLDAPRDSAAAHYMEEAYFDPVSYNDSQMMFDNMLKKIESLSMATVKKNRAKKSYAD